MGVLAGVPKMDDVVGVESPPNMELLGELIGLAFPNTEFDVVVLPAKIEVPELLPPDPKMEVLSFSFVEKTGPPVVCGAEKRLLEVLERSTSFPNTDEALLAAVVDVELITTAFGFVASSSVDTSLVAEGFEKFAKFCTDDSVLAFEVSDVTVEVEVNVSVVHVATFEVVKLKLGNSLLILATLPPKIEVGIDLGSLTVVLFMVGVMANVVSKMLFG